MFNIKAYGGQGGNGNYSGGVNVGQMEGYGAGGKGAEVGGDIELTQGEQLKIIVGGAGSYGYSGGGGGGTFVEEVDGNGTYTPLLIAGGGGGGSVAQAGGAGSASQTGTGGSGAFYGNAGGGGAGIHGSAQRAPNKYSGGSGYNEGGNYAGGSAGINQASQAPGPARGGFGGGGGGASYGNRRYSGGGGGGYTGGKGGGNTGAQGGSSLVANGFTNAVRNSGVQSGDGLVTITPAAVSPTMPANTFIYDTSTGDDAKTTTEPGGSEFGFSFTTTSASQLNMWNIAIDNPGNGTGYFAVSIYSNASNNTPGNQLSVLELGSDSSVPKGDYNLIGSGATVPSLNGVQDGPPVQFAAHTTYWLVLGNTNSSYLAPEQDNASPGIGYANEYTYDSAASTSQSFDNGSTPLDGAIQVTVCFAAGTAIRTMRGDVPVEALQIGDLAITASGKARPIRWLGHRTIDCRRHPRPQEVMPVRIAAHAIAENRPARDLLVSPGHAICLDLLGEVLVPAIALVNGATVIQDEVETVTYWHVELDSHDILLAENLPAESYMDVGNRSFFAEAAVTALDAAPDEPAPSTADYCQPFHPCDSKLVEVVRDQLRARVKVLGWRLAAPAALDDLWLEVDGVRVDPARAGLVARAILPATAREVLLCSTFAVPAQTTGEADGRRLGVKLAGLVVDDGLGCRREIGCGDGRLADGFHPDEGTHRWSDGRARLPAELWAGVADDFFLRIELAGPALSRWVAPAADRGTPARDTA